MKKIENKIFEKIEYTEDLVSQEFQDCQFIKCKFEELKFSSCRFSHCVFQECSLVSVGLNNSRFIEVVFEDSKVLGLNWTEAQWPAYEFEGSLSFYRCDISYSRFFELKLPSIIIESCKTHEVDFRSANLTDSNFAYTDFVGSQFVKTNLTSVDFTEATNYQINPHENVVTHAKFSFPEVVALLNGLEIKIEGL